MGKAGRESCKDSKARSYEVMRKRIFYEQGEPGCGHVEAIDKCSPTFIWTECQVAAIKVGGD